MNKSKIAIAIHTLRFVKLKIIFYYSNKQSEIIQWIHIWYNLINDLKSNIQDS